MDSKEISALIALLDDEDKEVFDHVSGKLLSLGAPVIPELENAWEHSLNPSLQERIEQIIHKIQLDYTFNEFKEWLNSEHHDLLKGTMIITKYQYPELDIQELMQKIDRIRREIWLEINDYLSPIEQVNIFNQVLYKLQGFNGGSAEITEPESYYLNLVLDSKKGNPLSLGILYLIIARQLDLPVYGVDLPHHFCIAYMKNHIPDEKVIEPVIEKEVLFYINPLNNGMIFTKNEINEYLGKLEMESQPSYFIPVGDKEIIKLLIKSLRDVYINKNSNEKAEEMQQFLNMF